MARLSAVDKLESARVRVGAIEALRADVDAIKNDQEAGEWLEAVKVAKECYGDKIDLSAKEFAEVVDSFNAHYYIGGNMMPLEYVLAKSRFFKAVNEYSVEQRIARGCSQSWADNLGSYAFGQWKIDMAQADNGAKGEILVFETYPIFEEASALDQNWGPPAIYESYLRTWRATLKLNGGNQQKAFEGLQRKVGNAEVGNCENPFCKREQLLYDFVGLLVLATAPEDESEKLQQSLPPKINTDGFTPINSGFATFPTVSLNRRDRAESRKFTPRAFSPLPEDSITFMASPKVEQAIKLLRLELPEIKSDREAKKWLIGSSVTKQCYGTLATMSRKRFVEVVQCFQAFELNLEVG